MLKAGSFLLYVAAAACAAACSSAHPPPAPAAEGAAPPPPTLGRAVARPRFAYSDGRTLHGGTAFFARGPGGRPLAVMSAHVVAAVAKGASLESLELIDAATKERMALIEALAAKPDTEVRPLDYATDVALLIPSRVPPDISVLELAAGAPAAGAAVELYACPADGAQAQVVVPGRVAFVGAARLEVELDSAVDARGFAGAPVVSRADGLVVGMAQAAVTRSGKQVLLGTPGPALRAALGRAGPPMNIEVWTASGR